MTSHRRSTAANAPTAGVVDYAASLINVSLDKSKQKKTGNIRNSRPRPAIHYRVLPPGAFNYIVLKTLLVYPERIMTIVHRTVATVTDIKQGAPVSRIYLYRGKVQELISRLDSRALRPVNALGLLVFSNNIKNGISDIRDIKCRIMACS